MKLCRPDEIYLFAKLLNWAITFMGDAISDLLLCYIQCKYW